MSLDRKRGDVITIFIDPITEIEKEGEAVLVSQMFDLDNGGPCETWKVRFQGEDRTVIRKIKRG